MKIEKEPYPALYPVPVSLITCDENIVTIAWIGTACYDPPMLCFAIRPERFSHDLLIGRIVTVNVDEELIENGKINYKKAEPICYVKGEYWSLGDVIGRYGFSKR